MTATDAQSTRPLDGLGFSAGSGAGHGRSSARTLVQTVAALLDGLGDPHRRYPPSMSRTTARGPSLP